MNNETDEDKRIGNFNKFVFAITQIYNMEKHTMSTSTNQTDRLVQRLRNVSHVATLSRPLWALVEDDQIARSSNSVAYIFETREKARQVRADLVREGREVSVTRLITA